MRRFLLPLAHSLAIAGLFLGFAGSAAHAVEGRVILSPNADYPGNDLETVRDVTLQACQARCVASATCRAFTYNERARWCFVKSDFGTLVTAAGATAGRIVPQAPEPAPGLEDTRRDELGFLDGRHLDEAKTLTDRLAGAAGSAAGYWSALNAGRAALQRGEREAARSHLGAAIAMLGDSAQLWIDYGRASLIGADRSRYGGQNAVDAFAAGVNAYLRGVSVTDRVRALNLVGESLAIREEWKPAIRAYRASLALADDPATRRIYADLVAQRGFRILEHTVEADSASPRICVVFSEQLPVARPGLTDFVTVTGGSGLAVEPSGNQICISGVAHGGNYRVRVREGLPSADGETLARTADLAVTVRDRAPFVGFAGDGYVLPAGPGAAIPLDSVNTSAAELVFYRIGERGIAETLRDGLFQSRLSNYTAETIEAEKGVKVWEGRVTIASTLNQMVTTAIPVAETVGQLAPGVYIVTARATDDNTTESWRPKATQWFVVSDFGITSLAGNDGIHVMVRSLGTAEPRAGVELKLIASNNDILGTATTDADGHALFGAGLARGTGGLAPRLVSAEAGGDFAFLDLGRAGFDLTDRGVEGRPAPAALDVFATTERGIYRPGETVHLVALARDARADAVTGLPITLVTERPDGVEAGRLVLSDRGLGGYAYDLELIADAMRGAWRFKLYSDPKAAPVAEASFLVEDFEPERLDFTLTADPAPVDPADPVEVELAARYLYGAPASGLYAEGDVFARPTRQWAAFPGYLFGRAEDPGEALRESIEASDVTDEEGRALIEVSLPDLPTTTKLYEAEMIVRLADVNGRAVERRIRQQVMPDGMRIGMRGEFEGDEVPEESTPGFSVIAVGPDGQRVAAGNLSWRLLRLERRYQWYRAYGEWNYNSVTTTSVAAEGTVDVAADGPARIAAPVEWGAYRMEIRSDGDTPTATSIDFHAGWVSDGAGADTPDTLQVSLDKPAYNVGDTVTARITPRFAGTAVVAVLDDRLIATRTVEVPAEGTTVDLTVDESWGPGAYVVATLYRPMDLEEKRMPARAVGLAWAKVAPGARDLDVALDTPATAEPRAPLAIPVSIGNLPAGEKAYVTVAAVDLGILNLTRFEPPAPDDWYFGQRRLGVAMRDLYGRLIDRTRGLLGEVRSGGDGGPSALSAPPPTEKLVAFFSGVVEVDGEGRAHVSFDLPAFNGTVRVMAMAWSAAGVGHAVKDVTVRDPVVVAVSLPRFLHLDDTSRLLVELDNVAGSAGTYRLDVSAGEGLGLGDAPGDIELAAGERRQIAIPLEAQAVGDHPLTVSLELPGGKVLPRDFVLGVRPAGVPEARKSIVTLAANGGTLRLDANAAGEFVPGTATVKLAAGPAARLNVAYLLESLDRYPYGCTEQLVSRALPLLYLDEVARAVGLGEDAEIAGRIDTAIKRILANQSGSGDFGLWGPGGGDLWLDAYVTDFLGRAAGKGFAVPARAKELALDNLSNRLAYASDFTSGGEDVAYALYVLAREGRASIGDLRYYVAAKLDAFSSPLARAQLGAGLALYGDRLGAETAFTSALAALGAPMPTRETWRSDYGSRLRDGAGILTLIAETRQAGRDLGDLARRVGEMLETKSYTSTQEEAWTLLAAAALIEDTAANALTIDGSPIGSPLFRRYTAEQLAAAPVVIGNASADTVEAAVTLSGIPETPAPAGGNGYAIEREYFTTDGDPADVATVGQNDRFVVVLTVRANEADAARLLVVDPLPAGFEIENPNLTDSGEIDRYDWLDVAMPEHSEARTDRFVAALTRSASMPRTFKVAYTVRAVTPGRFVHPGAAVEDMYRPEQRANTATAAVEVVGPTR